MERHGRLLAFIALIATALAVAFAFLWRAEQETEPGEVAAYLRGEAGVVSDATGSIVTTLMNYEAANVDAVSEELLPLATGHFRADYEELITQGLGEALARSGATSEGRIAAGPDVSFVSATKAYALATVMQKVTSSAEDEPRTNYYLMRLTFVDDAGTWKADELDVLSQSSG